MIRYSPNMTPQEQRQLEQEIQEMDRLYTLAEAYDALQADPLAEPEEDEGQLLRDAGLNMGQP